MLSISSSGDIGRSGSVGAVVSPLDAEPGALPSKGERTRSRILEIAVERFGAEGFRRTSVSAIAREVGITQAAVYAYFANKEALFEASVDADAEGLVQDAEAAIDPTQPLRDRLLTMFLQLTLELPNHALTSRVLGGQEPEVINRLLTLPVLQRIEAALTVDIAAGQDDGTVYRGAEPAVLAEGVLTMVLTILMAQIQVGHETSARRQDSIIAVLDAVFRPVP
jgi:AcrR family transcriptional regulator